MRIPAPLLLPASLVLGLHPALAGATAPTVPAANPEAGRSATVQVTATRFPEDPSKVPAPITVITGQELADRGIVDLRSALALTAGVFIAPGGDAGPASSVPEFWGLKEFDAFLLVVDGVPWGGAFNPALSTLNLQDVERIEVQRGAAPVLYGATSFVGVIHVIHRLPGQAQGSAEVSAGSHGSGAAALTLQVPRWAGFDSSLSADTCKQGFADPRTQFTRSHLLWRNRQETAEGAFHFDLDATALDQNPGSPHPRDGKVLSPDVPRDSNHNPAGAFMNDRRVALNAGLDRQTGLGIWTTTLAVAQSRQSLLRGFLTDLGAGNPDGHGFRERIDLTDLYFDTHLTWSPEATVKVVTGVDHLHGAGVGRGGDFDYYVALNGANPPAAAPLAADIRIDDRRDFSGLYGFSQWTPLPRLVVEAGLRLNRTEESRRGTTLDLASQERVTGQDTRTVTRLSGSAGVNWTVWQAGSERVGLFTAYRNTYKPAAIDFGLDSEAAILKPETAQSVDLGLKAQLLGGRLALEVSSFRMDFENLVVPQTRNGGPVKVNAGKERFQGLEASGVLQLPEACTLRGSYSYHDTRFTDYLKDFDGTPTQLAGKRLEMSPYHLAALGLSHAPTLGLTASLEFSYVSGVFLNQRNTAPAGGYTTLAASLGYRTKVWEVRLSGQNLTDRRNPVAESEMGDGQYYLMPGRQVTAGIRRRF